MSQNPYAKQAHKIMGHASILLSQTDWNLISDNNGVMLESKSFPEICPVSCFRADAIIENNSEFLSNCIWNQTEEDVKNKDTDVLSWEILDEGPDWKVFRQINRMPWPIWSREVVCAQVKVQKEDTTWIVMFSVNHQAAPRQDNQYVRAVIHQSIYKFIKEDNKTHVWKLSHIDPSGNIPAFVIDLYANKLAQVLYDWKQQK